MSTMSLFCWLCYSLDIALKQSLHLLRNIESCAISIQLPGLFVHAQMSRMRIFTIYVVNIYTVNIVYREYSVCVYIYIYTIYSALQLAHASSCCWSVKYIKSRPFSLWIHSIAVCKKQTLCPVPASINCSVGAVGLVFSKPAITLILDRTFFIPILM